MSYSSAVLGLSPVAYWRLGESSGTSAADASGNGNTGTYSGTYTLGAAGLLTGDSDTAASFAGGLMTGPYAGTALQNATIVFWFKWSSGTGKHWNDGADSVGHGWRVDTLIPAVKVNGTQYSWSPASKLDDGNRHMVALVADTSTVTLYIDASVVMTATRSDTTSSGLTSPLKFGNAQGTYDELSIHSGALTSAQISSLWTAGTTSGGTTDSGATAMSARSGMTVGGKVTEAPAVALSARAGMLAAPSVTHPEAVALSAQATLNTRGVAADNVGAAAMSAQAMLSVAGTEIPVHSAAAALSAQAGMAVGGSLTITPTATFSVQASLTVSGDAAPGAGTVHMSVHAGMSAVAALAAITRFSAFASLLVAGSAYAPTTLTVTLGGLAVTAGSGPAAVEGNLSLVLGFRSGATDPLNSGIQVNLAESEHPSLALYDTDGTWLAALPLARAIQWRQGVNEPGYLSFSLPLDDAATALVTTHRIVKLWWRGHPRQAVRIGKSSTDVAVEGRIWRTWDQLDGALAWLGDAAVYPERGVGAVTSGSTRVFGVGSVRGHWYASGNWTRAQGFAYSDDTGYRKGKPTAGLKGPNPWWLAKSAPYATVPPGSFQVFRREFTLATGATFELAAAADDYLTLSVDGDELVTPDQAQHQSWKTLITQSGALDAGAHVIAAKVQNSSLDAVGNAIAFLLALQQTDASGNPVKGAPLLITNNTWWVADNDPGWSRAEVLTTLRDEAVARGVAAMQLLDWGFGTVHDSDSQEWDDRGEIGLDIGSTLLDTVNTFTETHMDVLVYPGPLRMNAHKRLGDDLSAAVTLSRGSGGTGTLIKHQVDRVEPGANTALMQLRDGRWIERADSGAAGTWGRAEIGLSMGSTADTASADDVADKQFAETARPQLAFQVQMSLLDGPQLHVDFDLGDSIRVTDESGEGTRKVRVMAGVGDWSTGERLAQWLEVVYDPT